MKDNRIPNGMRSGNAMKIIGYSHRKLAVTEAFPMVKACVLPMKRVGDVFELLLERYNLIVYV